MPTPTLRQIAASLDTPSDLAPHLTELFAGLSSLGSMPRLTARLLRDAGLRSRHTVLDLACGKGAVTVELAALIGCRVTAVDGFPPFVDAAREHAARRRLGHLCNFSIADIRDLASLPRPFDAALMLGLDPLAEAAPYLRTLIRPRGLYVVDDCFRDPRRAGDDFPRVPTRSDSQRLIAELGDTVIACHVPTPSAIRRLYARIDRSIHARALALQRSRPSLKPTIQYMLADHRRAGSVLTGPLRPAIWVVRKGRV